MPLEAPESSSGAIPHVVVLGGGFAGLWAARGLRRHPVCVTLVDRSNHHLFQPLLYQVATAGLSAPAIAAPLRYILRRQRNVVVRLDEVEQIDVSRRRVRMRHGSLDYDYLVVATGSVPSYFGRDEWRTYAPGLKTLGDALEFRRRVLEAFESAERESDPGQRESWLQFVVIGAGPTGVELAGTLAEIARHTLPREFRRSDPRHAQVHLVEAGERVLATMPADLSRSAQRQLERLGVRVHLNAPVAAVDAEGVTLMGTDAPRRLAARTVLWAAGVAASPLGAQLGATDRSGRVIVADDLSLPGHPEVFVAGDLAFVRHNDRSVPGLAPAAKQMGRHVARAIGCRLRGQPAPSFRYRDQGNLATIGRMAAVVDIRGVHLRGVLAWWFWLVAHLFFLIGFRNRLVVLIDWAVSYWTYQRHARIVVPKDGREEAH